MFVLENIQKVEIIGGNSIDWLNVFCTFLSVLLGAVLAYYFSIKMLKSSNKKEYKYSLLVETLKYINLVQEQMAKRNEMIYRLATLDDISYIDDIIISIVAVNNNLLMYQNDIKVKTEILKNEIDSVDILEKLINDCKTILENINQQVMIMYAGREEEKVAMICLFNINEIEKKYKIYDTIYDCKRMIETKLKENKYN